MARFVYLPVEVKVREFLPKLWLASWLAREGFVCLLGTKRGIADAKNVYPPGVLFEKSISVRKIDKLKREAGFHDAIVCQDEEAGLARSSLEGFLDERVSYETLALTQRYYCWGNRDSETLRQRYPEQGKRIITTGSPRLDLWRQGVVAQVFREEIASLRDAYGRFLLVNSSFGVTSEEAVNGQLDQAIQYGLLAREEAGKKRAELIRRLGEFRNFVESVRALAEAMPAMRIVCRPHPAESVDDWRKPLADLGNVFVAREGDVAKWIGACSLVLHEGCTTAVQAVCMNRPAIALVPEGVSIADKVNDLPLRVSRVVRTSSELVKSVRDMVDPRTGGGTPKASEPLSGRIVDLEGPYCAARIAADLKTVPAGEYSEPSAWRERAAAVRALGRRGLQRKGGAREQTAARSYVMSKDKMPGGIGLDETRVALARFARLEPSIAQLQVKQPLRDVVKLQW